MFSQSQKPRFASAIIIFSLGLMLPACGEPTSLDLLLTPDPNVSNPHEIAKQLGAVRVVIDSSTGLYPGGKRGKVNGVELVDEDGDGQLEVVAIVDTKSLGRLPLIRLERGSLPDGSIELRISGERRDDRTVFVAGGVRGARFVADRITDLTVPFNVKLRYRAPIVTQTIPFAGSTHPLESTSSVFAIFSKKMNVDSIRRAIKLYRVEAGNETLIPAMRIRVQYIANNAESPTSAEYQLKEPLPAGIYRLAISTEAKDSGGLALDQVPLEGGAQPYAGQFSIDGHGVAQTMPLGAACSQGGSRCSSGLACNASARRCEALECPKSCPKATVCQPSWKICVPDCRVFGGFGGCEGKRCTDAGLCE